MWPSTWARSALLALNIKPTPKALSLVIRWQKSTPTEPWSNNPLGIPQKGYSRLSVQGTGYAQFQSLSQFNSSLVRALSGPVGSDVKLQLAENESPSQLWQAINSLGWPAAETESAWPIEIYNLIEEQYREALGAKEPTAQRTTGTAGYTGLHPALVMQTQHAMVAARQAKMDFRDAIRFIVPKGR